MNPNRITTRAGHAGLMTALAPSVHALAGVSIVLPCHNEEANVAAAVRMAARVGHANALAYEVIVVDDGSRDGTYAVATRLAAGDPHVRVVQHPVNRGSAERPLRDFDILLCASAMDPPSRIEDAEETERCASAKAFIGRSAPLTSARCCRT